jgi:hypothetical protein
MEILAAVETLTIPAAVDLAAIVIGALTGGLLAAREGFAVSGVLLLAVSGGLGGGSSATSSWPTARPWHSPTRPTCRRWRSRPRSRSSSPAGCHG